MSLLSFILNLLVPTAHASGSFILEFKNAIALGLDEGLSRLTFVDLILKIANFLLYLVAALALVAIIWGGVMYIVSLGDEARSARAKHIILFAIMGLLIAGIAEAIIYTVCSIGGFACPGIGGYAPTFFALMIFRIINILLVPAGAIAFGALIYGGYLYMTSGGEESRAARAKSTIFYALLGLLVIGVAGIIVNLVISLL